MIRHCRLAAASLLDYSAYAADWPYFCIYASLCHYVRAYLIAPRSCYDALRAFHGSLFLSFTPILSRPPASVFFGFAASPPTPLHWLFT
jgi:hypothetical protein